MAIINDGSRKQLEEIFGKMDKDVTMVLFTKGIDCPTCGETNSFLEEIESITEKLHLEVYDINENEKLAKEYDVSLSPSIVLLDSDKTYQRIKFNGIPAGHEINSLINSILEVSGSGQDLSQEAIDRINKVNKPIDIKVFVTLSCPHCPGAVSKAHKLALENPNISAAMIEAQTFGDLSNEYNVSSVPKILINDEYEILGDQPLEAFLNEIEKV